MLEPGVFDYIEGDDTQLEKEPLENLAKDGAAHGVPPPRLLAVHGHRSATSKLLQELWDTRCGAPWKVWS